MLITKLSLWEGDYFSYGPYCGEGKTWNSFDEVEEVEEKEKQEEERSGAVRSRSSSVPSLLEASGGE